jgi:hypothetical protein
MTDAEMTPGEIQRWLERIDKNVDALREEVRAVGGPTLTLRVSTNEGAIDKLEKDLQKVRNDVQAVMLKAAVVSGAIAGGGFLLKLLWGR